MYLLYTCACGPHLKIISSSKEDISGPYSVLAFQSEGPEGRRKKERGEKQPTPFDYYGHGSLSAYVLFPRI